MVREKLKTMPMQNLGVTNKEYYGMLWYFLEWSIGQCYIPWEFIPFCNCSWVEGILVVIPHGFPGWLSC